MNIIDICILAVLGISVIYGMYKGFISSVLSIAALIGAAALSFMMSGDLAAWLKGNQTLVDTLMYYTDAGSRISNLDLSLLSVAQVSESALAGILASANLPAAFESAFVSSISGANSRSTAQLARICCKSFQYPTARPAKYAAPRAVVSIQPGRCTVAFIISA